MKKLTDEEIQKMVEEKQFDHTDAESQDLYTYKLLFDALREPPEGGLSLRFADRVARQAFVQAALRQQKRLWLLQIFTISIALPLAAILLLMYQPQVAQNLFDYFYELRWILIFAIGMYLLIQWADYSLLHKHSTGHDDQ